jgi:hypothetical protein
VQRAVIATSSATPTAKLLRFLYSRENEAESRQAKLLTKDEARRIAANIARLLELFREGGAGVATTAKHLSRHRGRPHHGREGAEGYTGPNAQAAQESVT